MSSFRRKATPEDKPAPYEVVIGGNGLHLFREEARVMDWRGNHLAHAKTYIGTRDGVYVTVLTPTDIKQGDLLYLHSWRKANPNDWTVGHYEVLDPVPDRAPVRLRLAPTRWVDRGYSMGLPLPVTPPKRPKPVKRVQRGNTPAYVDH